MVFVQCLYLCRCRCEKVDMLSVKKEPVSSRGFVEKVYGGDDDGQQKTPAKEKKREKGGRVELCTRGLLLPH